MSRQPKSLVILISGRGSNLRALLDACPSDCKITVISNRPEAAGLTYARERGIQAIALDHRQFPSREDFDAALATEIDQHNPNLVILAGFMRILGETFVRRYTGRLLNIHPSLLPAFPGLHTHARALQTGVKIHGCTVHFVTPELDNGPIVIQAAVPVLANDDEHTLAARVLTQEHHIYPQALQWFMADRLILTTDGRALLRDESPSHSVLIAPSAQ